MSKDFRRTKSSISGFRAAHDSNQNFESGVDAKLFGKPETTAFRRYAQLGYFGVGNDLRFLLYSLTFVHKFGMWFRIEMRIGRWDTLVQRQVVFFSDSQRLLASLQMLCVVMKLDFMYIRLSACMCLRHVVLCNLVACGPDGL